MSLHLPETQVLVESATRLREELRGMEEQKYCIWDNRGFLDFSISKLLNNMTSGVSNYREANTMLTTFNNNAGW